MGVCYDYLTDQGICVYILTRRMLFKQSRTQTGNMGRGLFIYSCSQTTIDCKSNRAELEYINNCPPIIALRTALFQINEALCADKSMKHFATKNF